MVTDTTEKGLEALITNSLINSEWLPGDPQDYLPTHCVDLSHLTAFLVLQRRMNWRGDSCEEIESGTVPLRSSRDR